MNIAKKRMSPLVILIIVLSYFGVLLIISFFTSRNVNNDGFFLGNRQSRWYIVAIGMLGSSISGVTFISVPGWVQTTQMTYIQMVMGFVLGYLVIAHVLLPLYYRLNLTSIYTYLEKRFGKASYKTGASFFLLSRTIGSAARLYVVAHVLQISIFQQLSVPFWATVLITILLIWLYTYKGGIKTIIWTDTLQTVFLFSALIATIVLVTRELNFTFLDSV
ncbi:MAG: sodium:solute symporter, partial [Bacteroidales bacterium]|nr:sodium:solute symporter [Bacteroidales bacterium]